MSDLRIAVIGVGHLGQHHARVCAELEGVRLAGVSDADAARGQAVASRHGAPFFSDAEELLDEVDAVCVAVPTVAHLGVAAPFLERGIAALVEKPLAPTVREAEALVEAAEKGGAVLQVGHIERFNPAVRAALGRAARPVFLEAHRNSPFRFRCADVGVVFDLMIHDIDLARRFVGAQVESVEAAGAPVITDREDIATARLSFANGAAANLTASRVSMEPTRKLRVFSHEEYVTVDCAAGTASVLRRGAAFRQAAERFARNAPEDAAALREADYAALVEIEPLHVSDEEPLKAEILSFAEAARNRSEPEATGADGLEAVRIAAAVVAKAEERLRRVGGQ